MLSNNIDRTPEGVLTFAGYDVTQLAKEYGTPLYLMDEDRIRANCRVYTEAFRRHFGPGARPLYASKANSSSASMRSCGRRAWALTWCPPAKFTRPPGGLRLGPGLLSQQQQDR